MVETFAVIPVRDRHEMTRTLISQLGLPPDNVIVLDNESRVPAEEALEGLCRVIQHPERNISKMWNRGLADAYVLADGEPHDVAVLNNDLEVPPGFLQALSGRLRSAGAGIAYPDQSQSVAPGDIRFHQHPGPHSTLYNRMCGFAWMTRGELGLRCDEQFVWFYGDDDLEWRAMEQYGIVCVGGVQVNHLQPNVLTNADPALVAQTGLDRDAFLAKWGRLPH